jgi:lipopolysaccharide export LptBFGC system permease protein LptF
MGEGPGTTSTASAADRWDRLRYQKAELGIDIAAELRGKTRVVSDIGRMSSEEMRAAYLKLGRGDRLGRGIERSYWRRFALPLMALVFSVVGAGLALDGRGGPRARNALLALLAVIGYYVLLRIADLAALNLEGAALPAAWGPNAIALVAGLLLLRRAERPR